MGVAVNVSTGKQSQNSCLPSFDKVLQPKNLKRANKR